MFLVLLLLVFPAAMVLISGFTVSVFWNWFIAGPGAAFYGHAPHISVIQALGLSLVVTYLTKHDYNEPDDDAWTRVIVFFTLMWIMAIIYHTIMT